MNARQRALKAALEQASDNPIVQLGLIHVYANRLGASERDVKVVHQQIVGGPVRECAG